MSWTGLLKSAGSKAAMQSGKKVAENIVKKATEKKSKVKGKDIAKKMLGGGGGESSEKGGALAIRPSSSIVSSPAGGLIPTKKDEGGSLVLSNNSRDLGLTPFMESVIGVKESVKSIKDSLNDNAEDAKKRLEKQRLLNARLKKQEREEELETKKPGLGIGKKLLKPVKDAGVSFLEKLKRFFVNTLLGMFVNALIGGARDVVVAFIFGFKAYRMAKDAVIKFVLNLKGNIGKGLSKAGEGISKVGSSIGKFLGKVRNVLVGWIRNTVKGVQAAIKAAGKLGGKIAQSAGKFLQKTKPLQKVRNFIRNPGKTIQALQKSPVGKTVTNLIKSPGKTIQGGIKSLQKTPVGKTVTNLIKSPGKTLQGGIKSLQKTKVGKGATNILKGIKNWGARTWKGAVEFGSKKWKALTKWADDIAKNAIKWTDDVVKGGLAKAAKWRKQLGDIAELMKNPAKLADKVKGMLSGKMNKMVDNNDIIKKVKDIAKDPKKAVDGIKKFVKQVGKNKNVLKAKKVLTKASKLKIAGIDAVLAALMGVIDYTAFGESPINAVLRAAGALVGYTAGFAIGAPFGGVPGFITGMAGSWVGEKAADVIAAGLSKTDLGKTPDPWMDDGRMLVRDPFGGQGEGERMDNIQEKQAQLGDNKVEDLSQDISESASYEDGGEEPTVVIDGGGGDQAPPPISRAGKTKFISLELDKQTILNSNHEANTNAALYKV